MAAADWEEIKRLAADFQRAQLSSTAHKLSERNCIEIVNKLVDLKLLEIIYTTDGREYLTPKELEREIRDELLVNGGRINLVDLQQIINVDLSHIENKVEELIKNDRNLLVEQGELIDKDYLDRAAEEINDTLQEAGQVTLSEVSKTFGLSAEFLLSIIEPRLGSQIHGQLDPLDRGILFTEAFIARNIAKIRGIFSAITRPTQVISLACQYGLPEKLFYNVLNNLVSSGRLVGHIQGRQDKALYVPEIYTKTQNAWIDSFFNQNGYIEYDTLSRLGITDGRQFLKRRFQSDSKSVVFLHTCCTGKQILDQIDASVDEALATGSWVNIVPLLPSPFTQEDARQLLQHCLKGPTRCTAHVFCDGIVASQQFVDECKKHFKPLMKEKAEHDMKTSPALFSELTKQERASLTYQRGGEGKQQKKDDRHKKATLGGGQKGGAGAGRGRETKTRKTKDKSKLKGKHQDDEDEEESGRPGKSAKSQDQQQLTFMTQIEIESILKNNLSECEEDFIEELGLHLLRPLSKDYQEMAKSVFSAASGNSTAAKRKSHNEYQDKINGLCSNAKLFQKGMKQFDDDTQIHLSKYLLKTVGQDIVNLLFEMVASDHLMSLADEENFTAESRLKLLNKITDNFKSPLTKLNTSLNAKDSEDFFNQLDIITGPGYCDIMLKNIDKKKERQLIFNHRQALIDQLQRETEPAMALHLAVILLFQYHISCMIHAPGRCVPQIISFLENYLPQDCYIKLQTYESLVKDMARGIQNSTELNEDGIEVEKSVGALLAEGLAEIKDLAIKPDKKLVEE